MAKRLQLRRGTTSEHGSFTGALGEVTVDTDKDTVVVHDNATAGGASLAKEGWLSSKPHIIPDVLYPAVAGKLSDGSTSHSGAYGTAQSDTRSYYYTDIKGSKPIKDPRIGSHFGSQRHKFKSIQLLEQETATHGNNVYSVDGRENIRIWGSTDGITMVNDSSGLYINSAYACQSSIEVVGYFSGINILGRSLVTSLVNQGQLHSIDGVALNSGAEQTDFETSASSPLGSRFVDNANLVNVTSTQTLGIHTFTLKEFAATETTTFFGIELIAQDTDAADVNKIQIPSQNVVSYGKKFTVSGTPHYDPFNGFTNGTTLHSAVVDTATSLGLSTGTLHGATWAISGSNNIRPYNGGRVVKWVDSSGVIKTSVNMMPPNAQKGVGTGAHAEITTPSATNTAYLPAFSDDAIDHSLAEVAKTFHWREFGNGAANGGAGATYADASMLSGTNDAIAYVMDDGLTSLSCEASYMNGTYSTLTSDYGNKTNYVTFVGTGVSIHGQFTGNSGAVNYFNIVQNLPYGTHILKFYVTSAANTLWSIDGVDLVTNTDSTYGGFEYITFHQPKMPPIPDDAVVIADFMLMADFVVQSATTVGHISKGVRVIDPSRDFFWDMPTVSGALVTMDGASFAGGYVLSSNGNINGACTTKLPYFGTDFLMRFYATRRGTFSEGLNSWGATVTEMNTSLYTGMTKVIGNTLATNQLKILQADGAGGDLFYYSSAQIASPIHTSSHYQTFETPFLHELVGGDRNMEQTNLVVTPDGKTWDEVTRDVSYIGGLGINAQLGSNQDTIADLKFTDWRGKSAGTNFYNKGFAIAYDRVICLKNGKYRLYYQTHVDSSVTSAWSGLRVNGAEVVAFYTYGVSHTNPVASAVIDLVRGDYIQVYATGKDDINLQSIFNIEQV